MDYGAGEKSTMDQTNPPPYQGTVNPGYSQPAGYPAYTQGYGQQYPGQVSAVTVQPAVFVTQPPLTNPPKDYTCYSVFTLLCCCLPLGIAALIFSSSTRDAIVAGDRTTAEKNSRMALILNNVALGIGITIIITVIVVYVVVLTSAMNSMGPSP